MNIAKNTSSIAMAWWHNLCAKRRNFGKGTADKPFGAVPGTMEHARAKADTGIGFMQKPAGSVLMMVLNVTFG